ncbi:unnamed protein product [Mesocestoides corti]|uniref:Mannosyltransferase n=2 Tax=Mesocestoides corti TaxID=53468 RepID=A0A0R3ULV0_MESCO|nr:unnamed protein product [Mesocestoides corti]
MVSGQSKAVVKRPKKAMSHQESPVPSQHHTVADAVDQGHRPRHRPTRAPKMTTGGLTKDEDEKPAHFLNNDLTLFLLPSLIAFRILNSLIITTTFVPDEVWQSVEVAHKWVYGYGALTWEWSPEVAIRSPLYPLLFAGMYKLMAFFGIDSRQAIIQVPRLFHGFLAGVTDYTVYEMALKLSGEKSARWVLFAELTNWFTAYCAPRSLSNSLEWALHAMAFRHYPWPSVPGTGSSSPAFFLLSVGICVVLRPTAAVLWAPVCLHYLYQQLRVSSSKFWKTLRLAMIIGIPCLTVSVIVDRVVFGCWTVNQLNFLCFNLLSNGADFYGVQPWHWYLTNSLPLTLMCHLPLALIGWLFDVLPQLSRIQWLTKYRDPSKPPLLRRERIIARRIGVWIAWIVLAYSCLAHKEFRFLFPAFPLFMYYAGRGLLHLSYTLNKLRKPEFESHSFCSPIRVVVSLILVSNLLLASYVCLIHQRGPDQLMSVFARQAAGANWANMPTQPRILALMPCHSTPYLSYLHQNVSLRLLSCDPDFSDWHKAGSQPYVDEADEFYKDPVGWLGANYPTSRQPHYIAMFTELVSNPGYGQQVVDWLQAKSYSLCAKIFHAHFVSHSRHGTHIVVWCATNWNLTLTAGAPAGLV